MAESIAKAYVQVIPSAKGIKGALKNAIGPDMRSAGRDAGGTLGRSMVSKIKGVVATAGIGAAFAKAISDGAALEQSIGGIQTLFKESADAVIRNAEQAYRTAGMSANRYMELSTSFAAALMQSLGGDTQKAANISDIAMRDMSDNANKMGTDMERITDAYQGFAKQNFTMLDNLKLGYGGTKTEMQRLLADAQKITGIKYDISNLNDIYNAIHVIQGELDITGTTAKEAASTLSGSMSAMKAAFTNVLADLTLGRDLNASLQALTETTYTFVVGNLLPAVGRALTGLPMMLSTSFGMAIQSMHLVSQNAEALTTKGIELVTGIGSAIITAAPYLVDAAANLVMALGNAMITADWATIATNTIVGIRDNLDVAAGEILGADGNIVGAVLSAIQIRFPEIWSNGGKLVAKLANGLLAALPGLLSAAGTLLNQLVNTILATMPSMMTSGVQLIGQLANGLLDNLPSIISAAARILSQLLYTMASHLPQMLQKGLELVGQLAAGMIRAIPQAVATIPKLVREIKDAVMRFDWIGLGKDIIRGLIKGIGSMGGMLWNAAKSVAKSVLTSIKRALGIHSPSTVMRHEVGPYIPAGMALGIKDNTKALTGAMHTMSDIGVRTAREDMRTLKAPVTATSYASAPVAYTTNVYVYGTEGQDVERLAEIVMQKIDYAVQRRKACVCG